MNKPTPTKALNITKKLTSSEIGLLDWLKLDDGQYGECHGEILDNLIAQGLAVVGDEETGLNNKFIAKGVGIMYRSVSITEAGIEALNITEVSK